MPCGLLSGPATNEVINQQISSVKEVGEETYAKALEAIDGLSNIFVSTPAEAGLSWGGKTPWQRGATAQTTGIAYISPERPDVTSLTYTAPPDPILVIGELEDITDSINDILDELRALIASRPEFEGISVQDRYLELFGSYYSSLTAQLAGVLSANPIPVDLSARIDEWLQPGAIGMSAEVAQLLRDRAIVNADRAAYKAERDALDEHAARGFSLPAGVTEAKIARARMELLDQEATINRDILIQEAEWERDSRKTAMTLGLDYEKMLQERFFRLTETARAIAGEWQANHIKVALAAVEVFKAELEAFAREADALGKLGDTLAILLKSKIDQQNAYLEVFKTKLQAELGRIEAETKVIDSRIRLYGADIQNESARIGTLTKLEDIDVDLKRIDSQIAIEEDRLELQKAMETAKVVVEALSSVARTAAQLTAGWVSSLNMSASIGTSTGFSSSHSCSESYTYRS
jgi:hypothetical protein